ncbi:MAG TPA: alpha-(1-_3)-arabinofuranosyltransferase family protein [Nocardioides sp.]|nr:alpha-(1->3)-arabinofuranosyltransferase family protein [Nocardioides sp.]
MEPRAGAEEALSAEATTGPVTRTRLRLAAACALLTGLALVQSPGLLVADTKLDLAVAPGRFLLRAVHLWDPVGAFGQLQNQAYGYLWPMGPFFLGGIESGLPAWLVQRLWLALVLCVAFLGVARLARELGVRSDLACILGGFAYALSPRMLSTLGQISIEAWPSAIAPWVLLPLVIGSTRGSARRAAAWAALAVVMVGGVNAAATFAVIPLGVLWLLTRAPGRRQVTLLVWWPAFTVIGTLWWLVPLFVLGEYSPPFLDFIESASNTTFPTTMYDALRGTSNWVVYVGSTARAGNDLIRDPIAVLNSAAVVVLGLAGILQRRNPERVFLCLGVLTGMVLVTMGHTGSVQGWFAADLQTALDGVLAPLRNVHKFDPVVRLPLVLGLAWAVDSLVAQRQQAAAAEGDRTMTGLERVTAFGLVLASVAAVAGAAMPAALGRITPTGGFVAVPDYWSETTDWLDGRDATALLLPGSSFGDYVWGFPQDEPVQPLADSPWAVRNAVPLTPPGNIRMLDAIEARLAQGSGSPALASYLRRAGVTHVVVRNDLVRSADLPDPVLVHQALEGSEGVYRVASFGPDIGGAGHIDTEDDSRIVVNGGWQASYPAIEVYAVAGAVTAGDARTSQVAPVVIGGPEDLLDLAELGVIGDEPTRMGFDVATGEEPGGPVVLTDGLRAVERHFGRLHDGQSATLAPGEPRRLGNPTRDYLPEGSAPWETWARYTGIATVSASSSRSDATSPGAVQRGQLPFAAVDGWPETRWQASVAGVDTWWQVGLARQRHVGEVVVTAGPDEREVVRVAAGDVTTEPVTIRAGSSRAIRVDAEDVETIRIEDVSGRPGHRMSLAEVDVPGVPAARELVLPAVPEAWGAPARIVLRAVGDDRTGCVVVDRSVRCVPGREVAAEEALGFRRTVTLPASATYDDVRLRVTGRFGARLQALLDRRQAGALTASSSSNPDLRSSALAAIDGDPGTTWSAALSDLNPQLELRWLGQRTVRGLALRLLSDADARMPNKLVLSWPGGRRTVRVGDDGNVWFPSIRTDRLSIGVEEADPAVDLGFDRAASPVPIGISELRVQGVPFFPRSLVGGTVRTRCGAGPELTVAGQTFRTRVRATVEELYEGAAVEARICGAEPVTLPAGTSTVSATASGRFTPVSLVLTDGSSWSAGAAPAEVVRSSPVELRVRPETSSGLLTIHQNVNPGWTAAQDGQDLASAVVDGWQQGWLLDGRDEVRVGFEPDRVYRAGLVGGAAAALLLLLAALLPSRRLWGRTAARPLRPARVPGLVLVALGAGAAGVLAGWLGLVLGAAAIAVGALAGRRSAAATVWLVILAMAPAASAYLWRPWASSRGWAGALTWPHYLVLVVLFLVLGALVELRRPGLRRPRLRSRIAGRSTAR